MQRLAASLSSIYIQHLQTIFLRDFCLIFGDFSKNISRKVTFKTSFSWCSFGKFGWFQLSAIFAGEEIGKKELILCGLS